MARAWIPAVGSALIQVFCTLLFQRPAEAFWDSVLAPPAVPKVIEGVPPLPEPPPEIPPRRDPPKQETPPEPETPPPPQTPEPETPPPPQTPPPPPGLTDPVGWSDEPIVSGGINRHPRVLKGDHGEVAWVEFIALDREHYWTLGSVEKIRRPNGREEDMRRFLSSAGLQNDLARARDIVVIGAASCEYEDPTNPDEAMEERRAETRAEEMTSWLREVLPTARSALYSINLGRFRLEASDCPQNDPYATRMQRGAFLVSVLQKSPEIETRQDLAQLLKRHLSEEDNCLGIELGRYSRGHQFEMVLRRGAS